MHPKPCGYIGVLTLILMLVADSSLCAQSLDVKQGEQIITQGNTVVVQVLVGADVLGGANGTLTLNGGTLTTTGSADSSLRTTYIGSGPSNQGTLVINGGTLNIGQLSTPAVRADFEVGSFGGSGTATQTGGSVALNSTGGYFHIGNQGTGVYNLQDGSITTLNAFVLGRSTASGLGSGTLNISGGTLTLGSSAGALIVGGVDGTGTVTGGRGVINQSGGVISVGKYLELGTKGGAGIYTMTGGTLEIGGANGIRRDATGTYEFNFGGTLKVVGSNLSSAINAQLLAGKVSTINTNGLGATWSGNLIAAGQHQIDYGGNALFKTGEGSLILSGATRTLDTFGSLAGTTQQTAGSTTAVEFMVGSGTDSVATYTLNGGSLSINGSTRADNVTAVSGSLRVGDFGGTGTFTQTAGTVTVGASSASALNIGNQGGAGTYNLQGGSLILNGGNNVLARSAAGRSASSGALVITGGTLQLQNSAALIIGNNLTGAGVNYGSGQVTQTGGSVTVDASSTLYVAGYGNGRYDLDGGTLSVGGSSLRARYNNQTSSSVFSLGGGTLKITGSSLSSDVFLTAKNGTSSSIDTNSLDATFSRGFSGSGAIAKKGAGTLTLNGVADFSGRLTVESGRVAVNGSASAAHFTVRNGGSFGGHGTVGDLTAENGGTLRLGDTPGTLSVIGNLTLSSGSLTLLQISSLSNYDTLSVDGTLRAAGVLTFAAINGADFHYVTSFTLFDAANITGQFSEINLPTLRNGYAWNTSALYTQGKLGIELAAIPEPAALTLTLGAGVLTFVLWRRRARQGTNHLQNKTEDATA